MRIAYLASAGTLTGSPTRQSYAFEHDLTLASLRPALAARGAAVDDVSWDDPDADWSRFDAAVIGSTWDYWDRHDAFLAALAGIDRATRLYNPLALVRWNTHKSYLRELGERGARVIPTVWLENASPAAVAAAFDALDAEELVLKRQVGAGAMGQHRLRRGEAVPPLPHPMLAQPFQPAIVSEGEYSFVFVAGAPSHALVKVARAGDYRIQAMYGGVETAIDPAPADLAVAQGVLDLLDAPPLYARVDLVRGADGGLQLMEMELVEPYLYPVQGPRLGELMAEALVPSRS
jgi:hypothetical protein